MDTITAFLLGLVQGLAEYLPISSSGHLEISRQILGVDLGGAESLQFDVTLHVATVLSTIVILWHEFKPLCTSFFTLKKDENTSMVCKILVSCIPVGIVGVMFKDQVEEFFGQGLNVVGWCLLATAALLAFSYFFGTRVRPANQGRQVGYLDAFIIGIAQAVAVLPGLSRSGSTIATGLILGNRADKLAQFSFLMVIIPILGEALLHIKDLLSGETQEAAVGLLPLAVGFITAFIVGCIACKWMLSIVKKGKLIWFAVYCLAIGLICLIMR